jgi:hypothetical protein
VEAAFQTLKKALVLTLFLRTQPSEWFVVDKDANNVGIEVLSQLEDRQERVTGYYSKTLNKAERNYCVTRRELLAIVRSLEHFHKYLYGQ